jgi:hypothetical protein
VKTQTNISKKGFKVLKFVIVIVIADPRVFKNRGILQNTEHVFAECSAKTCGSRLSVWMVGCAIRDLIGMPQDMWSHLWMKYNKTLAALAEITICWWLSWRVHSKEDIRMLKGGLSERLKASKKVYILATVM